MTKRTYTEAVKLANLRYQKTEKGKQALKRAYQKLAQTERGKAKQILSHMKTNSRNRGHNWDNSWWSMDKIEDIIKHGKCAVTGLSFTVGGLTGTGKRNPFNASPDRIDNTKGYEPSNVQWVVFIYNLMKNNFNDEDIVLFVEALKNRSI
jgi:hypothetical protein